MSEQVKYGKGQEPQALKEAIREVAEAQKAAQVTVIHEKLSKVSQLLSVVQV
jgi:hypothetical protein